MADVLGSFFLSPATSLIVIVSKSGCVNDKAGRCFLGPGFGCVSDFPIFRFSGFQVFRFSGFPGREKKKDSFNFADDINPRTFEWIDELWN